MAWEPDQVTGVLFVVLIFLPITIMIVGTTTYPWWGRWCSGRKK